METKLETKQLKLLLKLLGIEGYHAPVSQVNPTNGIKAPERNRICYQLRDRGWVDLTETIEKIKITPSGKALLKVDPSEVPISKKELKILNSCQSGTIKTTETKVTPAKERNQLINSLIDRGFIAVAQAKPETITLNEAGKNFLLKEYNPKGTSPTFTLDMLGNYINLLRKHQSSVITETTPNPDQKLTDPEILDLIIHLDKEHNTNNYLPIFHLREKLQPPLKREELDQILYRLERNKKITTSSLVEPQRYSREQINAGIPQEAAGPLFFITVRS